MVEPACLFVLFLLPACHASCHAMPFSQPPACLRWTQRATVHVSALPAAMPCCHSPHKPVTLPMPGLTPGQRHAMPAAFSSHLHHGWSARHATLPGDSLPCPGRRAASTSHAAAASLLPTACLPLPACSSSPASHRPHAMPEERSLPSPVAFQ